MISFEILRSDSEHGARLGRLSTPHGRVETPVFMPVGTRATVKGLTPAQLRQAGATIVLANTYHLALRPGAECVAQLGGLHRFMGWDHPILTDSGGYQVFSLEDLRSIDDDGVEFRSHIDGALLRLSPERAIEIQELLGADVIMCFDECPPSSVSHARATEAVERTSRWAKRCQRAHSRPDQALYGIVQGGIDPELRERSARDLVDLDLPGYAIGGLSVGETKEQMHRTLDCTVQWLPNSKPRYLMGVGRPQDIIDAACRGVDMFDCVMPTRNGRNATAFTSQGVVRMRNARYAHDDASLDANCGCYTCKTFSRAYLRHLFMVEEMLGPILLSLHNVAFYCTLMREIREHIKAGSLKEFRARALAASEPSV